MFLAISYKLNELFLIEASEKRTKLLPSTFEQPKSFEPDFYKFSTFLTTPKYTKYTYFNKKCEIIEVLDILSKDIEFLNCLDKYQLKKMYHSILTNTNQ